MKLLSTWKRRKDGSCRKKEEYDSLEARSQKYKMGTHCWKAPCFSRCTCFPRGVENWTSRSTTQKFHISGNSGGMDAQVEGKPHQEPFVGGGTRIKILWNEGEVREPPHGMDHETWCQAGRHHFHWWRPTRAKTNRHYLWKQSETQLQKWKIID